MTDYVRPRGVQVYPMPQEVSGPESYAFLPHPTDPNQGRMVHTEGVAYLVNTAKPWAWTDYNPNIRWWSIGELADIAKGSMPVDLADWVRSHNHRLESNFNQVHYWAING